MISSPSWTVTVAIFLSLQLCTAAVVKQDVSLQIGLESKLGAAVVCDSDTATHVQKIARSCLITCYRLLSFETAKCSDIRTVQLEGALYGDELQIEGALLCMQEEIEKPACATAVQERFPNIAGLRYAGGLPATVEPRPTRVTFSPTQQPTVLLTATPTLSPIAKETQSPTRSPSLRPTRIPTSGPTTPATTTYPTSVSPTFATPTGYPTSSTNFPTLEAPSVESSLGSLLPTPDDNDITLNVFVPLTSDSPTPTHGHGGTPTSLTKQEAPSELPPSHLLVAILSCLLLLTTGLLFALGFHSCWRRRKTTRQLLRVPQKATVAQKEIITRAPPPIKLIYVESQARSCVMPFDPNSSSAVFSAVSSFHASDYSDSSTTGSASDQDWGEFSVISGVTSAGVSKLEDLL